MATFQSVIYLIEYIEDIWKKLMQNCNIVRSRRGEGTSPVCMYIHNMR